MNYPALLREDGECVTEFVKLRIKNRDIQKGKSGGYRLIYQVESLTSILLLTIYSKADREDISNKEIRRILNKFYGKA